VFHLVEKSPLGFCQTGSDAFLAAPSARGFDDTTHQKKVPEHCVQLKRSLISIFGNHKFTWITQVQQTKSVLKSLQNRACRSGLKISSREIHPATGVLRQGLGLRSP